MPGMFQRDSPHSSKNADRIITFVPMGYCLSSLHLTTAMKDVLWPTSTQAIDRERKKQHNVRDRVRQPRLHAAARRHPVDLSLDFPQAALRVVGFLPARLSTTSRPRQVRPGSCKGHVVIEVRVWKAITRRHQVALKGIQERKAVESQTCEPKRFTDGLLLTHC